MANDQSYMGIMETVKRMHDRYSSRPMCAGCPLSSEHGSNIAHCRKMAFDNPEKFADIVIEWGSTHELGVNEFSTDQERQIDTVIEAAENLVRAMTIKPGYLNGSYLKGPADIDGKDVRWPVQPSEIADVVADILVKANVNVFFPVHIENSLYVDDVKIKDVEYVRDTYNDPICYE